MFKLLGYIPPLPSIQQCHVLLGTNKTFPSPPGSIVPVIAVIYMHFRPRSGWLGIGQV